MNEVTEIDDFSLNNIEYKNHEDYTAIEMKANAKIAEPYGGIDSVYVGSIMQRREVFKTLTLYATIHYPDPITDGYTPQMVEGHIICSSIAELATVARSFSIGKILIIDRETLEILEVHTY